MDTLSEKLTLQGGHNISLLRSAEVPPDFGESRLVLALEAAHQGVWEQSLVTDDTYYSPIWWRMRGYEPDADLDNSLEGWLLRVHPDDHDNVRKTMAQQNLLRDVNCIFEYRERHARGHYIWIQSRGRAVDWDSDGKATRVLGTDTDITRQKQLEMVVVSERQRLRVMLGSIADAVIATDTSGCITYLNPSATALVLRAEEDCIGRPIETVFTFFDESMNTIAPLRECQLLQAKWENKNLVLRVYRGISRNVRCVVNPLEQTASEHQGFVVVLEDVSLSRQMERRLAFLANHDTLTRLPNRHAFESRMEKTMAEARTTDAVFSLCAVDLDRFKQINDSLGHAAGDYALQQIVAIMNLWKQPQDYVARVGGDEFVILMRDTSAQMAEDYMAKLEQAVDAMNGVFEGQPFELGLSYGIAQIRGANVEAHAVLRLADSRCYAHKSRGKRPVATLAATG